MKKIAIFGGNFVNKGAESMLFCLIDGLKKKYPNCELLMFDVFPTLLEKEKLNYNFKIINFHMRTVFRLRLPILKLIFKPKAISNPEKEIVKLLDEVDCFLDISGYGISSHNQGVLWSMFSAFLIDFARLRKKPYYLLPQSLGPFDFKGYRKYVVWPYIRKVLLYVEKIFVREPISKQYLKTFRQENIIDSFDIVLQSEDIVIENIFKILPNQKVHLEAFASDVVLIPNRQLLRLKDEKEVHAIYTEIIKEARTQGHSVLVLKHSKDDESICTSLKGYFPNDLGVKLLVDELLLNEIDALLDLAQVVVTSRYHGLIHSLKRGKAVMVIGWAEKYNYLMNFFNLNRYYHDVNEVVNNDEVVTTFKEVWEKRVSLSQQINKRIKEVNQSNYIDQIDL